MSSYGGRPSHAAEPNGACPPVADADSLPQQPIASQSAPVGKSETAAVPPRMISCVICRKRKLKCDRAKPSCGTCKRLNHACSYPEFRQKGTIKRRNIKELEARLAQVEGQLTANIPKFSSNHASQQENPLDPSPTMLDDLQWNDLSMDMDFGDAETMNANLDFTQPALQTQPLLFQSGDVFSNELIGLGLQEPLPCQEIQDELHDIYFGKIHPSVPMMHRGRYLTALYLRKAPICLAYAIWTAAASISEKHAHLQDVLYLRARRYAEADEMKGDGEAFMTPSHAQTWSLLARHEAQKMYLQRACMSSARCVRLVQMMGLHRMDDPETVEKREEDPFQNWSQLEEQRRTFWAAFCTDRYSSAGTGWPMLIDERDISTNLPSSEEAFEENRFEPTIALDAAMTPEGASKISPYAGVVLMACLFGHNLLHLHRQDPRDRPDDVANGEFWKRHRKIDNVISNILIFIPAHLKLPAGLRDPNVIFLNMNIHTSTICLHQAAIMKAEKHGVDQKVIRQSKARCAMAADEIVNIMRLTSHLSIQNRNAWLTFCLFVAAKVLIDGCRESDIASQSRSDLEFLLAVLKAMTAKHTITESFLAQLKSDMKRAGVDLGSDITDTSAGHEQLASTYLKNGVYNLPSHLNNIVFDNPHANISTGSTPSATNSTSNSSDSLPGAHRQFVPKNKPDMSFSGEVRDSFARRIPGFETSFDTLPSKLPFSTLVNDDPYGSYFASEHLPYRPAGLDGESPSTAVQSAGDVLADWVRPEFKDVRDCDDFCGPGGYDELVGMSNRMEDRM